MAVPAGNPRVRFDTIYVDEHLLVVSKPRGRVTLPGRGHEHDTLLNGVFVEHGADLARLGAKRDYGVLHRLDRATSGLVAIARTIDAYDVLREAFARRRVEKTYLTIVRGRPPRPRGTARMRLRQTRRGDLLVSLVDPTGVEAVTDWRELAAGSGRTLLVCRIETGRLHQIRAHLAALGCPVEGDGVYRGGAPDARGSVARAADRSLLLHAWRLALPHPTRQGLVHAVAEPPSYFVETATQAGISLRSAISQIPEIGRKKQGKRGS